MRNWRSTLCRRTEDRPCLPQPQSLLWRLIAAQHWAALLGECANERTNDAPPDAPHPSEADASGDEQPKKAGSQRGRVESRVASRLKPAWRRALLSTLLANKVRWPPIMLLHLALAQRRRGTKPSSAICSARRRGKANGRKW